ncbi:hypothetical protein G6F37_006903 [Rhizopus arrhizus]|nr:hypothetical protein G6F38_012173 [Rhizopus arrhizus]KAG1157223.1 hypothetical protein G6F37_006903 [Rhizopus arrhizus]
MDHENEINGPEQSSVAAVESLLPAMKDLDAGEIGESELACSIVHPLIQSLLAYEMDKKMAKFTIYEQYQPSFRTCFGGEESSDVSAMMDFYRLGVFAKLEIVTSNWTGVLCFQALGTTITFYALTDPHPCIYTFTEIATVTIPKSMTKCLC